VNILRKHETNEAGNGTSSPVLLHSPRLNICLITDKECAENYRAMTESKNELQRWMSWAHPFPSERDVRQNIAKMQTEFENKKPQARFSAHLIEDGGLAVSLGVTALRRDIRRFHISYWTRSSLTGRGYATEAVTALSRWLFEEWQANRIDSGCAKDNVASRRVLEKVGYTMEGVAKKATHLPPDGITDELIFAATDLAQIASFSYQPLNSGDHNA